MQDGTDVSGIHMELNRYKIELKEAIDNNFKNINDQMNYKFIDLSNLVHECSKIKISENQKDRDLNFDKNEGDAQSDKKINSILEDLKFNLNNELRENSDKNLKFMEDIELKLKKYIKENNDVLTIN